MVFAGLGDAVHPDPIAGLPIYVDPLNAIGLVGGADIEGYLNREDVKIAFNAQQSKNRVYHIEIGNNGYPQYELQYSACNDKAYPYQRSMIQVYQNIVQLAAEQGKKDFVIIISSGDVDPVVALRGTEQAVRAIGLPAAENMPRRPWFFNSSSTPNGFLSSKPLGFGQALHAHNAGAQVGGFTETFVSKDAIKLHFVTVGNSGHMVPAYAPQKALHILKRLLLQNAPIAPALETGWDTDSSSAWRGSEGHAGIFARYIKAAMSDEFLRT